MPGLELGQPEEIKPTHYELDRLIWSKTFVPPDITVIDLGDGYDH